MRGRVFAYFLDNHHGDGIVAVCCKSELGENIDRASREAARYYLPACIGARGWFGLRLDRPSIDWSEVRAVIQASYRLAAPRESLRGTRRKARHLWLERRASMKTELLYLTWVTILTGVLWLPYILDRMSAWGLTDTVGYPAIQSRRRRGRGG